MNIGIHIYVFTFKCTHNNNHIHNQTPTTRSHPISCICNTLQHTATHCNTLQHTATHCNTQQHTAQHCNTLQHTAPHYTTLHHATPHCVTLHHSAPHRNTPPRITLPHTKHTTHSQASFSKKKNIQRAIVFSFPASFASRGAPDTDSGAGGSSHVKGGGGDEPSGAEEGGGRPSGAEVGGGGVERAKEIEQETQYDTKERDTKNTTAWGANPQ